MKKHNMESLEQVQMEYENIKVPEELEDRVREQINRAKEDSVKHNKTRGLVYMSRVGAVVAAAMIALVVVANTNGVIAEAMGRVPILGAITRVVTFRVYESNEQDMQASIKVPQVKTVPEDSQSSTVVNKSVKEYTDEIIKRFEADVKKRGGKAKEFVYTDYKVITNSNTLFSLRINTEISKADTESKVKIYNIDKRTDRVIGLSDVFREDSNYINVISENIKQQMRAQMKADENIGYFLDDKLIENNFDKISENTNFYINKHGKLTIVFDRYEVAPGNMGVVEFNIPTDEIKDIVNPGYVEG